MSITISVYSLGDGGGVWQSFGAFRLYFMCSWSINLLDGTSPPAQRLSTQHPGETHSHTTALLSLEMNCFYPKPLQKFSICSRYTNCMILTPHPLFLQSNTLDNIAYIMPGLWRHLQETGLHLDAFPDKQRTRVCFVTCSDQWTFLASDMFLKIVFKMLGIFYCCKKISILEDTFEVSLLCMCLVSMSDWVWFNSHAFIMSKTFDVLYDYVQFHFRAKCFFKF